MSLSKLSKLPPEVLSSVINNEAIPLRRRLHLRLLCNRWADIIEDALKIETSLVSTDLTDEFLRPLSRLFTSLTQLTLKFGVKACKKLPSMLAHLNTSNLTDVKLYGRMLDSEPTDAIAIADALNALSGVTSLSIGGGSLLSHLGPVISRLEKFTCFDNLCKHISSFAPTRLTHLGLTAYVFESFPIPFLAQMSRNLSHLHLLNCRNPTIWQSISQMHALSSLTLEFSDYVPCFPFTDNGADLDSSFFHHLTHLTSLTHVELYGLKYRTPLALPSKKEEVSSIKRLTLEVHFVKSALDYDSVEYHAVEYHAVDYQSFFGVLSAWFPSLARLTLFTEPDTFPAIRASLGELAFSVKLADCQIVDPWRLD